MILFAFPYFGVGFSGDERCVELLTSVCVCVYLTCTLSRVTAGGAAVAGLLAEQSGGAMCWLLLD